MAAAVDRGSRDDRAPSAVDEDRHEDADEIESASAVGREVGLVRLLEVALKPCDAADGNATDGDLPLSLPREGPELLDTAHGRYSLEAAERIRADPALAAVETGDVLCQLERRA